MRMYFGLQWEDISCNYIEPLHSLFIHSLKWFLLKMIFFKFRFFRSLSVILSLDWVKVQKFDVFVTAKLSGWSALLDISMYKFFFPSWHWGLGFQPIWRNHLWLTGVWVELMSFFCSLTIPNHTGTSLKIIELREGNLEGCICLLQPFLNSLQESSLKRSWRFMFWILNCLYKLT